MFINRLELIVILLAFECNKNMKKEICHVRVNMLLNRNECVTYMFGNML